MSRTESRVVLRNGTAADPDIAREVQVTLASESAAVLLTSYMDFIPANATFTVANTPIVLSLTYNTASGILSLLIPQFTATINANVQSILFVLQEEVAAQMLRGVNTAESPSPFFDMRVNIFPGSPNTAAVGYVGPNPVLVGLYIFMFRRSDNALFTAGQNLVVPSQRVVIGTVPTTVSP